MQIQVGDAVRYHDTLSRNQPFRWGTVREVVEPPPVVADGKPIRRYRIELDDRKGWIVFVPEEFVVR